MKLEEFHLLDVGQKVKLNSTHIQFLNESAWDMNIIGGKLTEESYAETYFIWKAIGQGLPYTAEILRIVKDVGEGGPDEEVPGALLLFTVGTLQSSHLVSHRSLCSIRKKQDAA